MTFPHRRERGRGRNRGRLPSCTALVLLICTALPACSSDLAPGSQIAKLRLLAVRADRPFAAPGERVALDVLAIDPEERPLEWALGTCTNPAGSTVDSCLDALDGPLAPITLEDNSVSVEIPDDALSALPESARPSASVGVVLVACPGRLDDGATAAVPILCRSPDAGGEPLPITQFEVGLKRIFVRETDRNRNPEIARLTWDGEPWPDDEIPSVEPCRVDGFDIEDCAERLRHRIRVEVGTAESGTDEHGTTFDEQLIVQAYATSGVFREGVRTADSPEHVWAPKRPPEGELVRLWFVTRDDRGGVAWTERRVRVR